jgi:hypothetical protein
MAVLLIFTSIPAVSFSAFAAELQNFSYSEQSLPYDVILEKNEDITKSQWLHNLVVVFGIDQEEYLLPDNYYADLSEEHEFYKDVLMAVDCGLVNLEEGEMFYPDAVLNRDFAVSTLNAALGYQLGDDALFTFSDVSDCSDANSAQIALERGWVNLIDGKFVPTKKVTYDEAAFMLGDALGVVENDYVNPDYESSYDFLSDVKVVPSDVFATKDADGTVHITDCPIDIYENDKFYSVIVCEPGVSKLTQEETFLSPFMKIHPLYKEYLLYKTSRMEKAAKMAEKAGAETDFLFEYNLYLKELEKI